MPFVVSLLAGFVTNTVVRALITRAVVALGIGLATYTGIHFAMSSIVSAINAKLGALGSGSLTIIQLCSIPAAMNVVLSAYAGALALKGLTAAGAVTKFGISSAPGSVFSPGTF